MSTEIGFIDKYIERLKSVKLIGNSRWTPGGKKIQTFPTTRIRRTDLMVRFRSEAYRVLDRGRDIGGIRGRQTQSPRFNEDAWVNSFIANRISEIPHKVHEDKMEKKIRYLLNQRSAESLWQAILFIETRYRTNAAYRCANELARIENISADYWKMVGLTAA